MVSVPARNDTERMYDGYRQEVLIHYKFHNDTVALYQKVPQRAENSFADGCQSNSISFDASLLVWVRSGFEPIVVRLLSNWNTSLMTCHYMSSSTISGQPR